MATEDFAPAKINLALHVIGQRDDGYHLLDSLVVFAGLGDRISVGEGQGLTLRITGPFATALADDPDNLVLRAARFLGVSDAAITLEKNLPVASGIGGGSADAAATLRALSAATGRPLPEAPLTAALGADVPVCLHPRPRRMSGIGEVLADVPALPPAWLVLANPGVAALTPAIFRALTCRNGTGLSPLGPWPDTASLARDLAGMRNDLEAPATALQPMISETLVALSGQDGCLQSRMSGSGATCFGLFADAAQADAAAADLSARHPGWWVRAARILA